MIKLKERKFIEELSEKLDYGNKDLTDEQKWDQIE